MRILFFALALSAEPRRVVLLQERIPLRPMEHKTVLTFPVVVSQASLHVRFATGHDGEGIRVVLRNGAGVVAESGYTPRGTLRVPIREGNDYELVLENQRQRLGSTEVEMEAALVVDMRPASRTAHELEPKRRYFTVAASFTLFAMVLAYTAVRLGPAMADRFLRK
ncbi:MAG: hypothetical protein FJW30_20195 [Acidobacteria bacterium]|nr:hypothetical protein [Acidobacteriota bacterium]